MTDALTAVSSVRGDRRGGAIHGSASMTDALTVVSSVRGDRRGGAIHGSASMTDALTAVSSVRGDRRGGAIVDRLIKAAGNLENEIIAVNTAIQKATIR